MMLIPTYLESSPISGIGCFSRDDVKKSKPVWEWNPSIDSVIELDEYNRMPQWQKDYLLFYGEFEDDYWVLCGDNGKFWNHSEEPNVRLLINEKNSYVCVATRDIAAGEELTYDYRTFGNEKLFGKLFPITSLKNKSCNQ